MNENMLSKIKALSYRGAYLRTIKHSICEASSLMLQDKIRDRLNEMYNDVCEMIEQNDESIKICSTEESPTIVITVPKGKVKFDGEFAVIDVVRCTRCGFEVML